MWLINTRNLELESFQDCPVNTYAILSHTWGSNAEELDFDEFRAGGGRQKLGFQKILKCCGQARADNLEYAWVDTCCIDKRSSTELSEAINSMFKWYRSARMCYVYMADVSCSDPPISPREAHPFVQSRWFTRGWTLQELIAPRIVIFYTQHWARIGDKSGLAKDLQNVTGIPESVLTLQESFLDCCIAQRMFWASRRSTTRIEDSAYSLIGLFNVSMPLLYGEGTKAFLRLQDIILGQTDDETIFAWTGVDRRGSGLLAPSPAHFIESGNIRQGKRYRGRPPYVKTNRGLSIECELLPCAMNTYVVPLQCDIQLSQSQFEQIAVFVCGTSKDEQYRRILFRGKDFSNVYGRNLSDAKVLKIFVPDDGRTLELMPHSGLPFVYLKTNLYPWQMVTNQFEAREYPRLNWIKTLVMNLRNGTSGPETLTSYYSSMGAPIETNLIQFSVQDLEASKVVKFKRSAAPNASFFHQLEIGFDIGFAPICILRVKSLTQRRSRPYPFQWKSWKWDFDSDIPHSFETQSISQRDRANVLTPVQGLNLWIFKGDRKDGFYKRVNHLLPLSFGCTTFEIGLYPRQGLYWELTFREHTFHPRGHWIPALCPRRLSQTAAYLCYLFMYIYIIMSSLFLLWSVMVAAASVVGSLTKTSISAYIGPSVAFVIILAVATVYGIISEADRLIRQAIRRTIFKWTWSTNTEAMDLYETQKEAITSFA